jgi:integrase
MVFSYAVEESILAKTPIKKFKAGGSAERGAQPFTAEEIRALTNQAGKSDPDGLAIWLLYQTGVRLSSAISLTWGDVNGHITRPAMKRGKKVRLPIQPELKALLDAERARRNPQPTDFVLLNHETGKPFTGGRFYEHVKAFGKRAGVTNVHPHRFRDSFACDCLLKSCSTADVAFFLGDTTKTVEAHYAAFVTERAHRADAKVLSGGGLLAVEGTV